MDELIAGADASRRRREELDELLSGTFNSILRIEERSLDNRAIVVLCPHYWSKCWKPPD